MVEASASEQQEQLKQVLTYLQKKEARSAALDIILAYSANKEQRDLFDDLDVCKALLRLLPEDDLPVCLKVAQCLVNFSVDHQTELVSLNVAGRVFDFLKDRVQMNKTAEQATHGQYNEGEQVYEVRALAAAKSSD